jgi:hypothetical protein
LADQSAREADEIEAAAATEEAFILYGDSRLFHVITDFVSGYVRAILFGIQAIQLHAVPIQNDRALRGKQSCRVVDIRQREPQ